LHDWLRARVKEDAREYDIGEILEQADDLVAAEPREFEVVVPFAALPGGYPGSMPDEWMDSEATATWVDSADPPIEGDVRQAGAVQIRTRACDPWSAVEAASEVVNQAVARVALSARYGRLRSKNFGWVRGYAQVFPLRRQTRVQLRSLKTADQVFRVARSDADAAIDDALEIFSALGAGTRGASLTGGWAAVEGLLLRRTESPHVRAADRLAAIVACAFPRAELTTLSYRHTARPADDLAQALGAAVTNLERCEALERAMRAGCPPVVVRPSDRAMLRRVEGMLNAPQEKLGNVKRYVEETMRRLYTQRNLIMHAGSFQSVTLRATLRTAPRLVAAGVDRIVDARLSDGAEPLALAARAEVELGLLGSLGSGPLARLLA
jgi:hypothetical protein